MLEPRDERQRKIDPGAQDEGQVGEHGNVRRLDWRGAAMRFAEGKSMQAVLQDPAGDGDGTVVRSSAAALDAPGKQLPGDRAIKVEHQPAYEDDDVQAFAIEAIVALCKKRYEDRRHPLGDFPAPKTTPV